MALAIVPDGPCPRDARAETTFRPVLPVTGHRRTLVEQPAGHDKRSPVAPALHPATGLCPTYFGRQAGSSSSSLTPE
jgi:hypothetical protein